MFKNKHQYKISFKMTNLITNVKLNCYSLCLVLAEVKETWFVEDIVSFGRKGVYERAVTHFQVYENSKGLENQ